MNAAAAAVPAAAARASARTRLLSLGVAAAFAEAHHLANDFHTALHSNMAFARAYGIGEKAGELLSLAARLADHGADAHGRASELARALARAPAEMGPYANALDDELFALFGVAADFHNALRVIQPCSLAWALGRRLDRKLLRAQRRARTLYDGLELLYLGVRPSAGRISSAAARLLPEPDRARYREEYLSELWDVAHAGASFWQQARYALRQLAGALRMRDALLRPRRDGLPP
jgi:hypothetical protein